MNHLFESNVEEEIPCKIYQGRRVGYDIENRCRGECGVTVNGEPLLSAYGRKWEWGFHRGELMTNLAHSILENCLGYEELEDWLIRKFREDHVAKFAFEGWKMDEFLILSWVDAVSLEHERKEAQ